MSHEATAPTDVIPNCPVCFSKLQLAHNHAKLKICVCRDAHRGLDSSGIDHFPEEEQAECRGHHARRCGAAQSGP